MVYRIIKKVHLFAGIELFHYLCNVKEIMDVELIDLIGGLDEKETGIIKIAD